MNGYQFIASLVQSAASLAWPIAFAFAVWLSRRELASLLPRMRLKYKEFDVSFRLESAENGTKLVLGSSGQVLVHPGMVLLAFYFHIAVARQRDGKNTINGHRPHETTVALSYGFGCQNARMKTGSFELRGMLLSGRQHAGPPAFGPRADLAELFLLWCIRSRRRAQTLSTISI